MKCPNPECKAELRDDALFCNCCGARIKKSEIEKNKEPSEYWNVHHDEPKHKLNLKGIVILTVLLIIALLVGVMFLNRTKEATTETDQSVSPESVISVGTITYKVDSEEKGSLSTPEKTGLLEYELNEENQADGVTVTAVPNEGYIFVQWSDGFLKSERHDKLDKDDRTVYAVFEKSEPEAESVVQYTITYTVSGSGGVLQDSEVNREKKLTYTVNDSSSISVRAVAESGFHFVGWSDNRPSAIRTDTGFEKDQVIVAYFERDAASSSSPSSSSTTSQKPKPAAPVQSQSTPSQASSSKAPSSSVAPAPVIQATVISATTSLISFTTSGGEVEIFVEFVYPSGLVSERFRLGVYSDGTHQFSPGVSVLDPKGTYTVRLYNNAGNLLSSATFVH